MTVADVNLDGFPDVAIVTAACQRILLGTAWARSRRAAAAGAGSSGVALGDFNADGKRDLAIANGTSNDVSILVGKGDGSFQAAVNYPAGAAPAGVTIADVNADGRSDLVVPDSAFLSGRVSVLLGNGDATFQAAVPHAAGSGVRSVAVADFDSDGKADLAAAAYNSHYVSILLGASDGTFRTGPGYAAGATPQGLALRDLNADGKLDLVVADSNFSASGVSVRLGNGDGTFQAATSLTAQLGTYGVTVDDVTPTASSISW